MPNNYDFLQPILGDELHTQFIEKMNGATGVTLANIADGSHIPKAKFDEVNGKVKGLNATIADLNAQLATAKQQNGDVAALNAKITDLTNQLAAKQTEMERAALAFHIKDAVRGMNARDVDVLMPLLKLDKITEKDGKLEGLQEQVDELKKTYSYLFTAAPGGRGGFGGGAHDDGGNQTVNEAMNAAIRGISGRS